MKTAEVNRLMHTHKHTTDRRIILAVWWMRICAWIFAAFFFISICYFCLSQQQWYGNTLVGRLGIIKLLLQTDNVHRLYACVANDWDCCRFALSCFFYCTHRLMHSKCVLAMDILLTSTGSDCCEKGSAIFIVAPNRLHTNSSCQLIQMHTKIRSHTAVQTQIYFLAVKQSNRFNMLPNQHWNYQPKI